MNQVPRINIVDLPAPPSGKKGWPWSLPGLTAVDDGDLAVWPRISIVTPSYNQGRFLEATIRSVLLQNYPNLEYVVMDGGSSDDTGKILEQYAPLLSLIQSAPDGGQADALRRGFQLTSGEILAWINADDFYEPDAFRRIALFFDRRPESVFVNGDVNLVDENGRFRRRIFAMRPSHFFGANLAQHGWPQQGCFWRRDAYEAVGEINANYQFCLDLDLFTRLVDFGHGQRFPGGVLANFRTHPFSKTSTLQSTADREKREVIARYGNPFWSSKPRLMRLLWWFYRKQAAFRRRWNQMSGLMAAER